MSAWHTVRDGVDAVLLELSTRVLRAVQEADAHVEWLVAEEEAAQEVDDATVVPVGDGHYGVVYRRAGGPVHGARLRSLADLQHQNMNHLFGQYFIKMRIQLTDKLQVVP